MASRAEVVDDAVSAVQDATTDLAAVVSRLTEDVSPVLDEYAPNVCRYTAETVRDMALRASAAVASLQASAGMLRALSYEREEARHGG